MSQYPIRNDRIKNVNERMCSYTKSDVFNERTNEIGAKLMKRELKQRNIEGARSMYKILGLGTKGNEVEVESKWYEVSRRWGEHSTILLFVK